ncbi:N6-adenosine-methyltransferase catalytic subunit-like [Ylistrum balloti]|uniref:N6-adenosine-methyltransferase catalytic subunit-like n=1 Tax=Ylistrum balloti TaxID=509963 RepID=UPI002905A796|nr:N6-adenosine-methyltransferase catalytic subunit-like [Ylistrum balloti]
MSDPLNDIQAVKSRHGNLRAKMAARRKQREGLEAEITSITSPLQPATSSSTPASSKPEMKTSLITAQSSGLKAPESTPVPQLLKPDSARESETTQKADPEMEKRVRMMLCDISLDIPCNSAVIAEQVSNLMGRDIQLAVIEDVLKKFASQQMISITSIDQIGSDRSRLLVNTLDIAKLSVIKGEDSQHKKRTRDSDGEEGIEPPSKHPKLKEVKEDTSIESLLSMQSAKEKENKKLNEEILDLLTKPTAKEQSLVKRFKSQGGAQLKEFCQYGTREECKKLGETKEQCRKLHFRKIIHKHTDETLGDCSFLNTCFHMDTCKYVHYEIDYPAVSTTDAMKKEALAMAKKGLESGDVLYPPQWVQCDLRFFDMTVLGKCAVVMADPPWDIHMELPYGTMSDDEMRKLDVPSLQDDGFIFLWVTGRAMELGRECLDLWGYKRVDEVIWVKTNQLQRIIRTGRTGHWLNHGKEHCLVGVKGNPQGANRGLDCDVIVAEVRATSHKPDEIYGIIERLSPGTRKVELFGRPHNVQPNWITLGNQVEGVRLKDPDVVKLFRNRYPDGNCLTPKSK